MDLLKIFLSGNGRVTTDSRKVQPGDIFFALKGDNYDGNRFAITALERGAALAVTDDPALKGERIMFADNALCKLQELAGNYRRYTGVPLLAITGSNGKTTTRELISAVLSRKFRVHSSSGNLNNHIGVPLTILSAPRDTEIMVVEMGANHTGEIGSLCRIADPDKGIITNIGRAHLEGFGSFDGVVQAKSELYAYLGKKGGTIICNRSNQILDMMVEKFGCGASVVDYYHPGDNRWVIKEQGMDPGLVVEAEISGVPYTIRTHLFGKHNTENVAAAIATGLLYGVEPGAIVTALEDYLPENNRSQIMITETNRVVCDSYNANPSSMEEAINSFREASKGRGTVILGDMLELGGYSGDEHRKITAMLDRIPGFDVILVGPQFASAGNPATHKMFDTVNDLISWLTDNPVKDTFVMVKGSRGIGLEKIYPHL
ncbi:MAG: UDP-N-acetylmuramoyl-tripeptide--D-alanyl-D-alanine ligase [Bacteroidales bacterium]|nr:UDP-N-acetylmuramoyl-tripeptide--D-alanyl-D-alanine ligase [Bacteroidales bacterium]